MRITQYSITGIDFFNILDGLSNGMELLNFFDEALQLEREDGSAVLERGNCVIMDHCGFHHARFVEPVFRGKLEDCGVGLIYQPPYSPDFNTCELSFHQIKGFLQRHQLLAELETKVAIAIVDSCTCKTVRFSLSSSSFISNGLFSLPTVEHGIVICAVEVASGAKVL